MSAASSLGLQGSTENGKSIIHPATHQGCTCPLQGWGRWCPPLGCDWAGDTTNIATGHMGNGSCAHAVSLHIPNARRKRRFLFLRKRERERRSFNAAAWGDIPKTQLFSVREQTLPAGIAHVPCHGLQASSARVSTAPELRAPHGTGFLSRGESIDPGRALHQTSWGNCMVQAPLPHTDQKSQAYPNPSEERHWFT